MPTYNSIGAFFKQQLRNLNEATQADKVLRTAAVSIVPEIKQRIQQQGQKADGSQIGEYGNFIIKPAFGKAKSFFTKKQLKKVTKDTGYKDLRRIRGLQVDYVDLTFSGDMLRSLKPTPIDRNSYGIAFLSPGENKKAGFNERRYGAIFDLTKQELKVSLAIINKAAQRILSK